MMPMQAPRAAAMSMGNRQSPELQNSVFISSAELTHLNRLASSQTIAEHEAQKKAALRNLSQARYKNWGNTLEALRETKKRDRNSRLDKIEAAQRIVDDQEAKYQEEQRKAAIDRANRMLYQDNDRVKALHSGLLLSTVLKERQAQINLRQRKKIQSARMDAMYAKMAEENMKRLQQKEERELVERKEKSLSLQKSQIIQLDEYRKHMRADRLEEIKEGERSKKIAAEALREAEQLEALRVKRMTENNKEYLRANVEVQKIKEERARLEALEDAKIAEFAKEKERVANIRKEHELARFRNKQEQFEEMLAKQSTHLEKLRSDEQARVERQVFELEERSNANFKQAEARKQALKDNIERSRQAQMRRKKGALDRQKLEDMYMAEDWKRRNQAMEELEVEEDRMTRDNAKKLQSFRRKQMRQNAQKSKLLRAKDLQAAALAELEREREDQIFEEYAAQCVDDFKVKGRSVVPMKLILHGTHTRDKKI